MDIGFLAGMKLKPVNCFRSRMFHPSIVVKRIFSDGHKLRSIPVNGSVTDHQYDRLLSAAFFYA